MPVTPVNYKTSNTVLGYSAGTDLSQILMRREYFAQAGLYSWGTNLDFGLGDGTAVTNLRSSPSTTAGGGLVYWEWIASKSRACAGIKSDGTLWTWGRGTYGVLGYASAVSRSSPGTTAGAGTTWDEVSTSTAHMLAVKNNGTLWTWGRNTSGQLGTASTVSRSSPSTVAGFSTGDVGDIWKTCAAGGDHSAAITYTGLLYTWGNNVAGQLGEGTTTARSSPNTVAGGGTTWDKISTSNATAASTPFCAAIKTDGTLWTWGGNNKGQLGDNSAVDKSSPVQVSGGGTTWRQVACGDDHAVAIKYDGTLWTWGGNATGELGAGVGGPTSRLSPFTVAGGGTTWKFVSASLQISGGIKTDGTLWTWGRNSAGELGDGTSANKSSPVTVVSTVSNWIQVALGSASTNGTSLGLAEVDTYFPDISVYTVPGSYTETIPEGKQSAIFEIWGGGGGGGDGYTSPAAAGGTGGSGGHARTYADVKNKVGKTVSIVVGSGGASGLGGNGADGTSSTITGATYSISTMTGGLGTGGGFADLITPGPGIPGTTGSGSGGTDYNSSGASSRTGRNGLVYGTGGAGGPAGGGGITSNPGVPGSNGAVIITYL